MRLMASRIQMRRRARPGPETLIGKCLWLGGNNANVLNAGGEDTVRKFQVKPAGGNDVMLDGAAPPGATIDAHPLG